METVNEAVERVRKWFDHQIDLISYYPSEVHRLIILLSVMDSFAQESSDFSRNSRQTFISFLLANSINHSEFLKLLCPITLYYSYYNDREDVCLQLSRENSIYPANSPGVIAEAERLFELLPDSQKESAQQKHSYAGLIYQLRNKLSHELLLLNAPPIQRLQLCGNSERNGPRRSTWRKMLRSFPVFLFLSSAFSQKRQRKRHEHIF